MPTQSHDENEKPMFVLFGLPVFGAKPTGFSAPETPTLGYALKTKKYSTVLEALAEKAGVRNDAILRDRREQLLTDKVKQLEAELRLKAAKPDVRTVRASEN
jgi:hypothetical protein